jgi:hypothetical protein
MNKAEKEEKHVLIETEPLRSRTSSVHSSLLDNFSKKEGKLDKLLILRTI